MNTILPNTMDTITSDMVKALYFQSKNQWKFVQRFGTTRFKQVRAEVLAEMYNYLVNQQK
jgi:hypothetical protein